VSPDVTPRVSVVVPSYNNASFIEATMDSILAQSFQEFELVVADHSSTDGTWERLQRYRSDPRVRLLRTETGGGAPQNWGRVTAAAHGELLKLVCGWLPSATSSTPVATSCYLAEALAGLAGRCPAGWRRAVRSCPGPISSASRPAS
jgi:cellulose synthase/poly-beta-1,6-N-acetylglucosamine synthase-like glycosyltransferase